MAKTPYDIDLDRNPANFQPLTPLTFLERSASVGFLVLESRAQVVRQLVDDVVLFPPREVVADGAQLLRRSRGRWPVSVSMSTRCQSDMRGLVTAGRCFRLERDRVSSDERGLRAAACS